MKWPFKITLWQPPTYPPPCLTMRYHTSNNITLFGNKHKSLFQWKKILIAVITFKWIANKFNKLLPHPISLCKEISCWKSHWTVQCKVYIVIPTIFKQQTLLYEDWSLLAIISCTNVKQYGNRFLMKKKKSENKLSRHQS